MTTYPQPSAGDLELVLGIARRESDAFAAFYDRHAPRVMALLCRMLGQRAEAEDALQETFWQVWRQAGRHDPARGSPVAWVVQIARSRAVDRLRRARARGRHEAGPVEDLKDRLPASGRAGDEVLLAHESEQAVRRRLGGLPPEQQEAIRLAFFDGLTHHEISDRLQTPLGTIKTRIRLGMRKLREALQGPKGHGGPEL